MRTLVDKLTGDKVTFTDVFDDRKVRKSVTVEYITAGDKHLRVVFGGGYELLGANGKHFFSPASADRLYSCVWLMGWEDEKEMNLPTLTSMNR